MSGLEYLIGETISCFPDNRLPTIKDVLCFYAQFWGMRESDSIKENFVADQLRKFYQQKNIPVADKKSIKHQISRNVSSLRTILRFKSKKKTPTNIQKETVFRALLNETFEIRSENQTVNEHEIASTSNGSSMEVENFDGIEEFIDASSEISESESECSLEDNFDNDNDNTPDDPDFESGECDTFHKDSIPDEYLWQMFSTGVSFQALSTILELAFKTTNAENRFYTSKTYLYTKYQSLLESKENSYKACVREDGSYGTICFDHQNTQNISAKYEGSTHRLAIVWYSNEIHNVLGMVPMLDKTGKSQTLAIKQTCEEFAIERKQVVAVCCDNEASNVGIRSGTCVLLEKEFDKPLLRLMCRHHILEIVIKDVYHHLFSSETPNNIFYGMLKPIWSDLRESDFPIARFNQEFIDEMDESFNAYQELKEIAIQELRVHATNKHVRDDYREVTLVALKFFGINVQNRTRGNEVKFRALINPSNARFMATIIQGIEVCLFRKSRNWDSQELLQLKRNIKRFAMFASLIYVRYWNRSNMLFDAPINDLRMLQDLQKYKLIDESIANTAILALSRHLNYMSSELAPLCMFSTKLSFQEKDDIAQKLRSTEKNTMQIRSSNPESNHSSFSEGIDNQNYDWSSKRVIDLIAERSHYMFESMNLPRTFLHLNSSDWESNNDFIQAKKTIKRALICINDGSERVVSNSKYKLQRQRCRKESTFRQNILNLHVNPNM